MNDPIMQLALLACGAMLVWYFYMLTCRPEQFGKLMDKHMEWNKARHERNKGVARGAARAVLFGIKLWKR
ncbi:hypothetical protein J8F10_09280 [Gemmata sp. G18]|uniref:Uncharacterized protein n=1 Tax=Gemmata palustris TaxID=2822762 RepID=A0ABS5BP48_9BACT|nr:hypothetical protein [Gemmata palustris]MBP3955472.1 hypothetical protein [Gemmata palustris]